MPHGAAKKCEKMKTETVQKEVDYNSGELIELHNANPDFGKSRFFGNIMRWTLSDGSHTFDVELDHQKAAAPDEKSAELFLSDLQQICKKHGIIFEEEL